MSRLPRLGFSGVLCVLAGCASTPPPVPFPARDGELGRLTGTARAAFTEGSLPIAVRLYQQALTRARALDTATEIGNAAYNLAACRIALGEYDGARELLDEAESELGRAKANLADVLLLEAKLAHWQGRRDATLRFAGRVLADPASTPSPAHRAEVALLNGHLACDDREVARAWEALAEAAQQNKAGADPALLAGTERLRGRIFLLESNAGAAAGAFEREAAFFQKAQQPREMARALMRAGEAWRDAGQPAPGAERYFRAARSFFAQGDHATAAKSVELSLALAEAGFDAALAHRARQLQAELHKSAPAPH